MLFAVELLITLLLGFVLGRVWEIRQRIIQAEPVDGLPRSVEIRIASKPSKQPPRDDDKLLVLDREMKELVKSVAVRGRGQNFPALETRG